MGSWRFAWRGGGGGGRPCLSSPGLSSRFLACSFGAGSCRTQDPNLPPPTRFCLAYHVGNSCSIGRRPGMVVVLAVPGSAGDQNQVICGREGFAVTRG